MVAVNYPTDLQMPNQSMTDTYDTGLTVADFGSGYISSVQQYGIGPSQTSLTWTVSRGVQRELMDFLYQEGFHGFYLEIHGSTRLFKLSSELSVVFSDTTATVSAQFLSFGVQV